MVDQKNLKKFNKIYDETYSDILKFIIIKIQNINDVNDILQETYITFWTLLNKKEIENKNLKSYLIGIALNKIKKHSSLLYKLNTLSLFNLNEKGKELIETIPAEIDIENLIIKEDEWNQIWNYIKSKKDQNIPKIFYLHYKLEIPIKKISEELNKSESYIKNCIYRTLKELSEIFGKGV